ncbi:hypothetical protein DL98DRAFT_591794 [Cadophora sp. DSE1049]|nr:hypothetical protein DL98DRAFT_591794 [Cadophora sp. DSE1049]
MALKSSIKDTVVKQSVFTKSDLSKCLVTSSAMALCDRIENTSFYHSVINSSTIDKCELAKCCSIFRGSKARDTTFDSSRISRSAIRRSIIFQCSIRNCDPLQTSEIIEVKALTTLFSNCEITKSNLTDSTIHECDSFGSDNTITNCDFTRAPLAFGRFPIELVTDLFPKPGPGDTNVVAAMRGGGYIYKEAMREMYKNYAVSISENGLAAAKPYRLGSVPSMHVTGAHALHILLTLLFFQIPRPIATRQGLVTYNVPPKVLRFAKSVRHLRVDFEGHNFSLQYHKVFGVARVWTAALGTVRQVSMVIPVPDPSVPLQQTERDTAVTNLNERLGLVGTKTVDTTVTLNQETWSWKVPARKILVYTP